MKLGKYEKGVLLLMLKSDEPPGNPNLIWIDICQEFEITFGSIPKKYQPEMFDKEQRFKCVLSRLVKQNLIKPAVTKQRDGSFCDPQGYGYNYYSLTEKGRLVAEKLQKSIRQKELFPNDKEALNQALNQLYILGYIHVTVSQVIAMLWQQHPLVLYGFGDNGEESFRLEFNGYWNNTKLGLMLYRCTFGQVRVGVSDRQRRYSLVNP